MPLPPSLTCYVDLPIQTTTQHERSCTVFGILYNLIIGLLYFLCIAIMLFPYVLFEWNQATIHPSFRVQWLNIERSKNWNRNYIFKNVNYGWTLTQSYRLRSNLYLYIWWRYTCKFLFKCISSLDLIYEHAGISYLV